MVELVLVSIGALLRFCLAALVFAFILAVILTSSSSEPESVSGGPSGAAISTCGPADVGPPIV